MNEIAEKKLPDDLKTKAVRGASINVVGQFLGFIFHTIGVIVLARLLMPEAFGIVAMVTAFSLWFMNFGFNGFTEFIIQKQEISEKEVNAIFWSHLILATCLSLVFIILGFFLVEFYQEPALSSVAAAMASSFILYALFTTHFALLKRDMKFTAIAIVELIAVIASIALSISAALGGMGYWAVVIRQLAIPVILFPAGWFLSPWRPGRPEQLQRALPAIKYAIKVYCNFTLGYLTKSIDKVLMGKFHGSAPLGTYDRAYHLSSIPVGQLLSPLHNVALATLSRLKHDRERFISYYIKSVSMVSFVGALVALIFTITAQDVIVLLLGPQWFESGKVATALGPGIAAMLVYGTHSWLHLSLGTPGRWLQWNIFATGITIAAFFIAAPYGAVAMGIAYSASAFILILPGLWFAGRPIHLDLQKITTSTWAHFVSAALLLMGWMFSSAYATSLFSRLQDSALIAKIAFIACLATLLYTGLVIMFERGFRSINNVVSFCKIILHRQKPNTP